MFKAPTFYYEHRFPYEDAKQMTMRDQKRSYDPVYSDERKIEREIVKALSPRQRRQYNALKKQNIKKVQSNNAKISD